MADGLRVSPWLTGLLLFIAGAVVSVILPALSPILGASLLISGFVGYRQSTSPGTRRLAAALLVSGLALLILVLFGAMLIATNVTHGAPTDSIPAAPRG